MRVCVRHSPTAYNVESMSILTTCPGYEQGVMFMPQMNALASMNRFLLSAISHDYLERENDFSWMIGPSLTCRCKLSALAFFSPWEKAKPLVKQATIPFSSASSATPS